MNGGILAKGGRRRLKSFARQPSFAGPPAIYIPRVLAYAPRCNRMSFLIADPKSGEILDTRDLARTVMSLLDGTHSALRAVVSLGELSIVSKRNRNITVVDPIHHLHKQPLAHVVPAGKHHVSLAYANDTEHVAAAIVRFKSGAVVAIEQAAWTFPFQECTRFSLESSVAAIFDYVSANNLDVAKEKELAALLEAQSRGAPANINLPRARWNAVVFRVPIEGNGFYSCHWAKDENGDLVALVVDFAIFASV